MARLNSSSAVGSFGKWLLILLFVVTTASSALALEVREVRWGFNNAIKRETFNLCTIELINPTSVPFQGPVQLKSQGTFSLGHNTPWTEANVYIGPGETRSIQFVPMVSGYSYEWELIWGGASTERLNITMPQRIVPEQVAVQFVATQTASSPLTGIEVFHEEDFPIGAAGTETLGSVVLDHVPQRWDTVRTRAFRDWLGRGGRLYLIQGRDGKPLAFPPDLDELNFPGNQFTVGQGTVTRHAIVQNAAEIDGLAERVSKSSVDPNAETTDFVNVNKFNNQAVGQLFQTMRTMIRPRHNWGLIFLLAIIYLLILFPGIWLFSRQRGDYRVTYSLILATVVAFSWFYAEIGKRGYGESTGLRAMLIGYPLGNQRLALQKYGSLFVTEGGSYPLSAHGEGAVMSVEDGFSGRIDSGILNRPEAGFVPDIPPYSACSFQERVVLPTQGDYSIQIKALELGPQLKKLEVVLGNAIPATSRVYLVENDKVHTLKQNGASWSAASEVLPVGSVFPFEYLNQWSNLAPDQYEKNLEACLVQIATRATITSHYYDQYATETPPNDQSLESGPVPFENGHLLVLCEAPAELLPKEYSSSGKVLFVAQVDSSMATTGSAP